MKKLIIILALVLAFSTGMILAFYFQSQHTHFASLISKVFLGENIPFNVFKKFDGTIYYVTDRKQNPTDPKDFLNEYSGNNFYGVTKLSFPTIYRIGDTLPPDSIKKVTPLSQADFLQQLKSRADKPLVIWIHGFKMSFKENITYFGQLANDLNYDATFLTYDWASKDSTLEYQADVDQLAISEKKFVALIDEIVKQVKPKSIVIITHSLGSRLVALAFQDLYKNPTFADKEPEFQHVIFLAPNLDRDDFDKNFKNQLTSLVNKLTIYASSDDNALLISKFLHNINSLGLPAKFSPETELDEIQAFLFHQKAAPYHIDIVDVSYFKKRGLFQHSYFQERPVIEDLHWLIHDYPSQNRYLLKESQTRGLKSSYWFIPP